MIVVDDRLLFEVLSGTESAEFVARASGGVATTFSWFYRLSRAISTGRVDGSLTREFASLSDARRTYVHGLLEDLPDTIEMLHPRDLVPPMSAIAALTSVNFLTAEAIATSIILEATIVVSTQSALMDRAAAMAGASASSCPGHDLVVGQVVGQVVSYALTTLSDRSNRFSRSKARSGTKRHPSRTPKNALRIRRLAVRIPPNAPNRFDR